MKKLERARRRLTSMVWGQEHTISEGRWRELDVLSQERSRGGGGRVLLAAFSCRTGGWWGGSVRLFEGVHRERTRVMAKNSNKGNSICMFEKKKKKKPVRVAKHWNKLSTEVVKSPILEPFKTWLDTALTLKLTQPWAGGGSTWPLKDLCSLWVCLQISLLG